MSSRALSNALGLVGAAVGGVVGFFLYGQLLKVGLYALVLPGALVGLGANLLARHRSWLRGLVCGAGALKVMLLSDWYWHGFKADPSLMYYLTHLGELDQGFWAYAMLAVGTVVGFWWGGGTAFGPARPARVDL